MELLSDPQARLALITLTALELVLGIDNVIFISILVDKLPRGRRELARRVGLVLAISMRIGLLLVLSWLIGPTAPLLTELGQEISGRDLILIAGVLVQIMLIDLVFSLDSIITPVGMVDEIAVMVAAVVISVALMMAFAGPLGRFVSARPTVKMLALAFLFMIGLVLRDGVLGAGRDAQHARAAQARAGAAA